MNILLFNCALVSEYDGVSDVRGSVEAAGSCRYLPVPGDPRPAPGPAPQLRGHLGLRATHMEIREYARLLQRPCAVPPTRNTQYMFSYVNI